MLYVPILKCKQGEKDALFMLENEVKDNIVPLLELTPDVIGRGNFSGISDFWKDRPFMFDVSFEHDDLLDDDYFKLLAKCDNHQVIPVIKLSDSNEKISKIFSTCKNGIALRLYIEEILDDDFESNYQDLLEKVELSRTSLIIDVQHVESSKINEVSFLINGAINLISNISEFQHVIFASNSFPDSLQKVDRYEITILNRLENKLFQKIKPHFNNNGVNVIYSDYAVNHWTYFEYKPGIQPSFNIRYTTEDYYVIYKGDTNKKGGLKIEKIQDACQQLISSQYYMGRDYSWGDNEIYEKAHSISNKPGNFTTWRAIATNHHITFIADLLSNQS
ncbi:beta family protein [Bacillus albus]|uniref:beta family protein n=1 Tax=Bacillus TaxID=1386 RepID=UPI00019FEFC2|nr:MULTISPECIES: beta family protein [Bacillus]MDJ0282759.1 beta family protein [Bacillus bombysepticus]EEK49369.1 hypothetical protein bcere0002_36260 [Bacillus cereus ATCC 10876]KFL77599.1 beta family protein [Bacillus cereus ATCC 10876]MBG9863736.1 hypothetical protein [Bacillus cereus]MBO1129264.1 beta family protein [Bacillus cereus]